MHPLAPQLLVLVDTEGTVVQRGHVGEVRDTLKQFLAADRSLHRGRYASLTTSQRLDAVDAGDVVEFRAGNGGQLWDRFTVFSSSEWAAQTLQANRRH